MKKRIIGYFAVMGASVAAGFAQGVYLTGNPHGIAWGAVATVMFFGLTCQLAIRRARSNPEWDPNLLISGFRPVYTVVGLLAGGVVFGHGLSGWDYLMRTHQPPPSAWIAQAAAAVILGAGGAWRLSWPPTDPERGPYRLLGWLQIATGVVTALFAILTFAR